MMTITSITQSALGAQQAAQQLHAYQNSRVQSVSPELRERLQQYGVSVELSPEAQAYRFHPERTVSEKQPPIPLWSAIFKRLGLIE